VPGNDEESFQVLMDLLIQERPLSEKELEVLKYQHIEYIGSHYYIPTILTKSVLLKLTKIFFGARSVKKVSTTDFILGTTLDLGIKCPMHINSMHTTLDFIDFMKKINDLEVKSNSDRYSRLLISITYPNPQIRD
jgi:hypothetical protein